MGDVFDLDVLEVEAEGRPFDFQHAGEVYTLPAASDVDWRAAAALDDGNLRQGLLGLLGDEAYARFAAKPLSSGKLGALVEAYMRAQGLKPGESLASSDSSESTEKQSRPISPATTESDSPT